MRGRARRRGDRGGGERAGAARGPDGALRDPRLARGGTGARHLAAVGVDAVRDPGAVRDVRGRDRAGAGAAGGVRRARSEGRRRRQRARRAGRAAAEPQAGRGGGAVGGRVGRAATRLLRIQTLALPIARPASILGRTEGGRRGWTGGARKPLWAVSSTEGSNPSPSAGKVAQLNAAGARPRLAAVAAWVGRNRLVLATGLAGSLPVIASTVHAVSVGWFPLGDDAITSVR